MKKRVKLGPRWSITALWWHAWELLGEVLKFYSVGIMSSVSSYLHFSVILSGAYYTCPFLLRDSVCSGSCITHSLSKDECFLRLKRRCILIAPEAHSHTQHMINTSCSTFSQPALPASSFSSDVFPLLHSFLLMGEKIDSKGMKWPEDLPLLPRHLSPP